VLGEHTDTVLGEWLGLNAQAAEALRAEGAV
jgi:crotonobetainyl-CoA:carnitine CoA-transferase CaiB-like acyl-CoA transferase